MAYRHPHHARRQAAARRVRVVRHKGRLFFVEGPPPSTPMLGQPPVNTGIVTGGVVNTELELGGGSGVPPALKGNPDTGTFRPPVVDHPPPRTMGPGLVSQGPGLPTIAVRPPPVPPPPAPADTEAVQFIQRGLDENGNPYWVPVPKVAKPPSGITVLQHLGGRGLQGDRIPWPDCANCAVALLQRLLKLQKRRRR